MNLLTGRCVAGSGDPMASWSDMIDVAGLRIPVPDEFMDLVSPGDEIIVGIRPEYLRLDASSPTGIAGTTVIVENLGTSSLVTVELAGGTTMQATVPEGQEPEIGALVRLTPEPGRVLLYRADDGELITD